MNNDWRLRKNGNASSRGRKARKDIMRRICQYPRVSMVIWLFVNALTVMAALAAMMLR